MRSFLTLLLCFPFSVSATYMTFAGDLAGFANAGFDQTVKSSTGLSFGVGGKISDSIRLETTAVYQETQRENASLDYVTNDTTSVQNVLGDATGGFTAGFVSAYYDFKTESKLTPFIGIGAGIGTVEYEIETTSTSGIPLPITTQSETNFISKFSVGMSYFGFFIGYDLFKSPMIENAHSIFSDSQLNLGVRLHF